MRSGGKLRRALLVTGVVLFGLVPAASAATIDFEDRPSGDTVNSDYDAQGVTFNGPRALQYGAGFAHSGNKAIEGCTIDPEGCSFSTPPPRIRADFTTGQTTVGVWVGVNADSFEASRTIRLTAYDGGGNEVGQQEVTVAAGTPVNSHLTVTAGGPTIRALDVSTPDGIFDIVVDDVEFSTAGPPPPCTASGPPTVNLTSPADNTYLQNDTVLLKGNGFPSSNVRAGAPSPRHPPEGRLVTGSGAPQAEDGEARGKR